ncbi:MAG: KEOPS complex subunit Pcc1 [Candidatus Bathyarchaeia archaeon]
MEAEIIIQYDDCESAEVVAKAVSPDNFKVPSGLSIETRKKGSAVYTYLKCRKKLLTFIATIDDLLSSISIAERTIQTVKKLK